MTDDRPDFGVLLALASVAFASELRQHMAGAGFRGFSTRTGYLLRVLNDGPLSLRALADELRMTSQATLKIVDAMDREGFVVRRPSEADGRVRLVTVTDHGHAALSAARAFHAHLEAQLEAEMGAKFGPDTAAQLRDALCTLAARAPTVVPQAVRVERP